jgi:hypothetical protein
MTKTLVSRFAVATAALGLGLGLLGAAPSGAQTTTVPNEVATLTVTKAVVGTAPAGTTFTLHILCNSTVQSLAGSLQGQAVDYDEDIPFGATGGSQDFVFGGPSSCTITETADGGADSSTGPVTVDITDPIQFNATITNTFNAVATTTTEAPAAAAVQATPAFTG